MQATIRGLTERSGEVFLLDILSHRMSVIGIYRQSFEVAAVAGRTPMLAFRLETEAEMPENKTKATTLSVGAYIEALADPTRRSEAKELIQLMQRASGETSYLLSPGGLTGLYREGQIVAPRLG